MADGTSERGCPGLQPRCWSLLGVGRGQPLLTGLPPYRRGCDAAAMEPRSIFDYEPGKSSVLDHPAPVRSLPPGTARGRGWELSACPCPAAAAGSGLGTVEAWREDAAFPCSRIPTGH